MDNSKVYVDNFLIPEILGYNSQTFSTGDKIITTNRLAFMPQAKLSDKTYAFLEFGSPGW